MLAQEEIIMIKGKRSKRPRHPSPLALTMATTSSSTTAELSSRVGDGVNNDIVFTTPTYSEETTNVDEEEDMANCLILLAKGSSLSQPTSYAVDKAAPPGAEIFKCKTCDKNFPSFQALGGHRASHNKPNKPINITQEEKKPLKNYSTILSLKISSGVIGSSISKKSRIHECSICGAGFVSGQALGGHMRRHRQVPSPATGRDGGVQEMKRQRNLLALDLNLPAPEDDQSKFAFGNKEQVTVFTASPNLVDCHY